MNPPTYSFCPFSLNDLKELFLYSGHNTLLILMVTYSQSVTYLAFHVVYDDCGEFYFNVIKYISYFLYSWHI